MAYLTNTKSEPELEKIVDEIVDNIEIKQRANGYFNSAFNSCPPQKLLPIVK